MIFIQPLAKRSTKTRQKKPAINKIKRKIRSLNDSETASETEVIKFFFFFYFFYLGKKSIDI